jgi:hypothetical protein
MGLVTIRPAVRTDLEHISRMDARAGVDQSRRAAIESAICRGECLLALDGTIRGCLRFFSGVFVKVLLTGVNTH